LRREPIMLWLHGMLMALQVAVPAVLLLWLARGRNTSISQWVARATLVLLYLRAVHVAGLWLLLPWYTAMVFAGVAAGILMSQVPRIHRLPWTAPRAAWHSLLAQLFLAVFTIGTLLAAGLGRRPPTPAVVDLQFPLRGGAYYITGGGSVELLNPHLMTLTDDRFRAYRGQSYGIDVVKLDTYGWRAVAPLPADPAGYAIYGSAVHAPCSGRVVQAEDGAPDMSPPHPDRSRMAGNHVLLECDGVHVLLAHLQPGSIRVRREQTIEVGAIIGTVGNSGNTNEPHLHIHAQRPAPAGHAPLSGDPLPIRLDGRYLVRNDRVNVR
jgi:hypothetical protein